MVSSGEDTFVLYCDGSCELLSAAIESRKEDVNTTPAQQLELSNSLTFSNPSIHSLANGNRILTYFVHNNVNGDYHLVRLLLSTERCVIEAPKRFKLTRENLNVNVAGAAVIEGDGVPMLLTICKYDLYMFFFVCSN